MPLYLFDITDGCTTEIDDFGLELENDLVAVQEALAGARSILADADRSGKCFRACTLKIRCDGRLVGQVPFTQALTSVVLAPRL